MFIPNRLLRVVALSALAVLPVLAQSRIDPQSTMSITLPEDGPVALLSAGWGDSTATTRGGAMLLELHTSLTMRNTSSRHLRGITLLVTAQDVSAGGKASVSVPSLNVAPGEAFPVRIDMRLLRPLMVNGGPLAEVTLDGVLFDDLSFYGQDKLNSRRAMLVWELEARRDRRYFRDVLERGGEDGLKQEMVASLARQADRVSQHARMSQSARATNLAGERQIVFAFLEMPGAPVELTSGLARVSANELRSPRVYLQNRNSKAIKEVEMGWLVRDPRGRTFVAGTVPLELSLPPAQSTNVLQDATYKFSDPSGQPIAIEEMRAFVNSVQYEDGSVWIPRRNSKLTTPSPEEQRLAEIYRKRGVEALVQELKKF